MGVDAFVFAEKSKRCYYFDRKYNLLTFEDHGDDPHFAELAERLNNKERITGQELLWMCQLNIAHKHREGWNFNIMRFVVRSPEDERFFVVSDHDNPYSHDVIDEGGYEAVEFEEAKYWLRRWAFKRRQHRKRERLMTPEYKQARYVDGINSLVQALSAGYAGRAVATSGVL